MAVVTKTLKSSGGDYSLMSTWESTEQTDLVTDGDSHVLECDAFTCTDTVSIAGWTTGASNDITIKAASGAEHNGVIGAGFVLYQSASTSNILTISSSIGHITVQDIEVEGNNINAATGRCFYAPNTTRTSGRCLIQRCIFHRSNTINQGLVVAAERSGQLEFYNNLVIDNGTHSNNSTACYFDARLTNQWFYNNTFIFKAPNDSADICVKFNYAHLVGNTLNIAWKNNVMHAPGAKAFGWNGAAATNWTACTNNATTDTATLGTSQQTGIVSTAATDFVDFTNDDYSPESGGKLEDNGTDLSGTFTDDITGTTRSGTWDIGAYERVAAGGVTPSPFGHQRLDNQYSAIAASRLNGVLQ